MASGRPSEDDEREVAQRVLTGLAAGAPLDELEPQMRELHPRRNTFPAEILLSLAADALEVAGVSRAEPLTIEAVAACWPTEPAGRTQRYKCDYVIRTVAMIHGGIEPDLLDDTGHWQQDDLWFWALQALYAFVGAAAERSQVSPDVICSRLAARRSATA